MYRLVITKLTKMLSNSKQKAKFADPGFASAINSLLSYSIKCVTSDYLVSEQPLVLRLLLAFYPVVMVLMYCRIFLGFERLQSNQRTIPRSSWKTVSEIPSFEISV